MDFDQEANLQIRLGDSHENDYQIWMTHRKNEENIQLRIPTELTYGTPTDAEHRTNYNPSRRIKGDPKKHSQWIHNTSAMKIHCKPIYKAYNEAYLRQYGEQ